MPVPYAFGAATTAIPLSQLDDNFNTTITLGNTAIQLGNTVTTLNNMTLANVTISSGNVTITNVSVTTVNAATVNTTTLVATTANVTTINATDVNVAANVTLNAGTVNGVAYLNGSKVLTTGSALTFDGTNFATNTGGTNATLGINSTSSSIYLQSRPDISYSRLISSAYPLDLTTVANQPISFGVNNSEQMRLTSTGLGIGTSSPAVKLHVSGQSRFADSSNASNYITIGAGANAPYGNASISTTTAGLAIVAEGAGNITFRNNGSEAMRIDTANNLGLGVTPSAWGTSEFKAVQVGIGASFYGRVASGDQDKAGMSSNAYNNGSNWLYIATDSAAKYDQIGGGHYWYTAPSGTAGNAITFTQAMTLDANGNLGVGTTSPQRKLDIYDATAPTFALHNSTSGTGSTDGFLLFTLGADTTLLNYENGYMAFSTNAAERARITSGGSFVVAAAGNDSFTTDVGIKSLSDGRMGCVVNDATTGTNSYHLYNTNATNNGYRFYVNVNGGINNYSANNVNLSDRREKTDFAPAGEYLSKICAIPVQTYKYIDQSDNEKTLGVVAQDVQVVAPELVSEDNWGTEEEPKMRLSIYQTDLQYALMKALQELKAEFDAYKATHP